MEMCFHGNQHPSSIKHPFISLYSKYQFFIFNCFPDMHSPVFPILDDNYCMLIHLHLFFAKARVDFGRMSSSRFWFANPLPPLVRVPPSSREMLLPLLLLLAPPIINPERNPTPGRNASSPHFTSLTFGCTSWLRGRRSREASYHPAWSWLCSFSSFQWARAYGLCSLFWSKLMHLIISKRALFFVNI